MKISESYIGEFHKDKHTNAGCPKIENDRNLFILKGPYGTYNIWQVGGKVSDMNGTMIPHLYKVRRIEVLFE